MEAIHYAGAIHSTGALILPEHSLLCGVKQQTVVPKHLAPRNVSTNEGHPGREMLLYLQRAVKEKRAQ